MRPRILTLTTDFGANGPYVASMKGVVLSRVPDVQFVDISHGIGPQNILEGAFVLACVVDAFPVGTVHLAVIDPGVGTHRRLVAAKMADQWFVLPDNGLLTYVAREHPVEEVFELENPSVARTPVSNTFHGRDLLAPAAAHLTLGLPAVELGPKRHGIVRLSAAEPRREDREVVGEVIFRDAFGNLITNVPASLLGETPPEAWEVELAGHRIDGLTRTYGLQPPGTLVSLVGSSGWLEVSLVNGDAARYLDCGPGATVWFRNKS
ncbi:SAM hydrolase/SAM-dependent halogenase family protein [Tautonia plasticadhaerens]|uniref:Adenosyl-chloride synthase n=1 Tax=Tautonia plasticadhaerens TaxID=2527974 RepID=A0A518H8N2_9BACT|nr:SAM-dependent chlorinase/fluorinase [Tautonia plasticadhaerens]QDV37200.1 Adenosyl-chloride synthase [Tautonia plasticadhaerens]